MPAGSDLPATPPQGLGRRPRPALQAWLVGRAPRLRAVPVAPEQLEHELGLRARVPGAFATLAGLHRHGGVLWLLEEPPRGVRLQPPCPDTVPAVALLCWSLAVAGHPPAELDLRNLLRRPDGSLCLLRTPPAGSNGEAGAALALAAGVARGRRLTSAVQGASVAAVAARLLGSDAPQQLLAAALGPLPDAPSWAGYARLAVERAAQHPLPQVLCAPDLPAAHALAALVLAAGAAALQSPALFVAADEQQLSARLRRPPAGPLVAVVAASPSASEEAVAGAAEVLEPPALQAGGLFHWLQPLRADPTLVLQRLVPWLLREPARSRANTLALLRRAGAVLDSRGPMPAPDWHEVLATLAPAGASLQVLQPASARLRLLLSLSPGGLSLPAVHQDAALAQGLPLLQEAGLATARGEVLLPAGGPPRSEPGERRHALSWLSEREWLAPPHATAAAWRLTCRLRALDLDAWTAARGEAVLQSLLKRGASTEALLLLEAHAAAAAHSRAGPPGLDAVLAARDLANAGWPLARQRRLLRLWRRGYQGPWLAVLLALEAAVQRSLAGPDRVLPLLARAEALAARAPRLAREQALLEAAWCAVPEDPARAMRLLEGIGAHPARAAGLLCSARMSLVRAHAAFIRMQAAEAFSLLQQARDELRAGGSALLAARVLGEIEALQASVGSYLGHFRADIEVSLAPLRELAQRFGGQDDLLQRAVVSQHLFRMRLGEVGAAGPDDMAELLANARPDNRRGLAILLYQLSENAAYRGDLETLRTLLARQDALGTAAHMPIARASTRRHEALLHAMRGEPGAALRAWRQAGLRGLTEPWRSRSRMLQRGEGGLLRVLLGLSPRHNLERATAELAGMSAGARASAFRCISLVWGLLQGTPAPAEHLDDLRALARRGFRLPALVVALCECTRDRAWDACEARLRGAQAPPFWTGALLLAAALLARAAGHARARELARAAAQVLPPAMVAMQERLKAEFPTPHAPAAVAPELAAALLALSPAEPALLARQLEQVLAAAGATRVLLQLANAPATPGPAELQALLDRAMITGTAIEGSLAAVALPAGGLACDGLALPALQACAARAEELLTLHRAAHEQAAGRARARELADAAWELAAPPAQLAHRLAAVARLVRAETGAAAIELALLRAGTVLLTAGSAPPDAAEARHSLDPPLLLRVRAHGVEATALQQSVTQAANAVAAALRTGAGPARLQLSLPQPGEPLWVAGQPLGAGNAAHRLYADLLRMAPLDITVAVVGEPGCGKDLAARALHELSPRAALPLVAVDCAVLRPETAASELFGHVRGAFTGATSDHVGLLERAAQGTLLLDGVAELAPAVQAILLRALQQRRFLPVGGTTEREFRARLVITAPAAPEALAASGKLRPDLAARLAGLTLLVPPLREREGDAELLAEHFLAEQAARLGRKLRLGTEARAFLRSHSWPGNVRELRACVARAAALCTGPVVTARELAPHEPGAPAAGLALPPRGRGLATGARLVLAALRGVPEAAPRDLARMLGLSRTTVSLALTELARLGEAQRLGQGRSTRYRAR
ncbi:MAG: sigma 54-interacting transcriptional regulator [Planctomycetes bacterium]|nr:sigma 54-interacting transcriptional regulator [Planctomycetota bacterium]